MRTGKSCVKSWCSEFLLGLFYTGMTWLLGNQSLFLINTTQSLLPQWLVLLAKAPCHHCTPKAIDSGCRWQGEVRLLLEQGLIPYCVSLRSWLTSLMSCASSGYFAITKTQGARDRDGSEFSSLVREGRICVLGRNKQSCLETWPLR